MWNTTIAAVIAALALSGCAGDPAEPDADPAPTATSSTPATTPSKTTESTEGSATPTPTPSAVAEDEATTIDVTITGDKITPNGQRVSADVGEPVRFKITSDRAGEFHVHSSPEQTPAFSKGTSTVAVTIDTPGVVDVEEHESGIVIAQMEVR